MFRLAPDGVFLMEGDGRVETSGIACDSAGRPWMSIGFLKKGDSGWTHRLCHYDGTTWQWLEARFPLPPQLQDGVLGRRTLPISIDVKDRIYLPATIRTGVRDGVVGHVLVFCSQDRGKTFQVVSVFPPDAAMPHRGLNIERFTGHHSVVDAPWLLFSTGRKGANNAVWDQDVANRARAVQLFWEADR